MLSVVALSVVSFVGSADCQVDITPLRLDQSHPGRYARSFMGPDSTVHLLGLFEIIEQGRRVVYSGDKEPSWSGANLSEAIINTFLVRPGLFLGLRATVEPLGDGKYAGTIWRSTDDLKTVSEERTVVVLPEAGKVDFGSPEIWAGIFFHRAIVESTDGSLLAAMYGNFEADSAGPTHPWSKTETKFKLRAYVVRSTDEGKTWSFLANVAVPDPAVIDDSEGFNEWSICRLEDGRLLGVVRTGHFTPMVLSWSSDEGRTWTAPRPAPELGPAGVDPCLLGLSDGRVALAYGQMVQPTAVKPGSEGAEPPRDTRRRCCLAISDDKSGERWSVTEVSGFDNRSAYATIFEVAPRTILYQADLQLWRIEY